MFAAQGMTATRRVASLGFAAKLGLGTAAAALGMAGAAAAGVLPDQASDALRGAVEAVTPVESSASLTTKREAMKITVGSPNPASAWSTVSTPVAQSDSATPNATTPIGSRSQTNTATVTARMRNVIVESLMSGADGVHLSRTPNAQVSD